MGIYPRPDCALYWIECGRRACCERPPSPAMSPYPNTWSIGFRAAIAHGRTLLHISAQRKHFLWDALGGLSHRRRLRLR
jgi:hypothetical protein